MPDIRILKALNMTPAEWGKLPIDGDERRLMREKAIAILDGKTEPIVTKEQSFIAREQAIADAQKSDVLTRSGFETAMVHQAQQFGYAVEDLREKNKVLAAAQAQHQNHLTSIFEALIHISENAPAIAHLVLPIVDSFRKKG